MQKKEKWFLKLLSFLLELESPGPSRHLDWESEVSVNIVRDLWHPPRCLSHLSMLCSMISFWDGWGTDWDRNTYNNKNRFGRVYQDSIFYSFTWLLLGKISGLIRMVLSRKIGILESNVILCAMHQTLYSPMV